MDFLTKSAHWVALALALGTLGACARTDIIESPRTTFVAVGENPNPPKVVWSSRGVERPFDYLGRVESRSWTYDGALERLREGGKTLGADAIIDIHYQRVGFMKTMQAFAIKFKQ